MGSIKNYRQSNAKVVDSALSKYLFLWKEKKWNTKHSPILHALKKKIMRCNICHFRQAENTPLAGQEVIDSIGFGATMTTANKILKGTANIDSITDGPTSKSLFEIFKTSKQN